MDVTAHHIVLGRWSRIGNPIDILNLECDILDVNSGSF